MLLLNRGVIAGGVGRDNTVLDVNFKPQAKGTIRCREELGGTIKHYYREAA